MNTTENVPRKKSVFYYAMPQQIGKNWNILEYTRNESSNTHQDTFIGQIIKWGIYSWSVVVGKSETGVLFSIFSQRIVKNFRTSSCTFSKSDI